MVEGLEFEPLRYSEAVWVLEFLFQSGFHVVQSQRWKSATSIQFIKQSTRVY